MRCKDEQAAQWSQRYNQRVRDRPFEPGDEVLLHDTSLANNMSSKLNPKWVGPLVVSWKGTQGAYEVRMGDATRRVSGNRLKRYYRRVETRLPEMFGRVSG